MNVLIKMDSRLKQQRFYILYSPNIILHKRKSERQYNTIAFSAFTAQSTLCMRKITVVQHRTKIHIHDEILHALSEEFNEPRGHLVHLHSGRLYLTSIIVSAATLSKNRQCCDEFQWYKPSQSCQTLNKMTVQIITRTYIACHLQEQLHDTTRFSGTKHICWSISSLFMAQLRIENQIHAAKNKDTHIQGNETFIYKNAWNKMEYIFFKCNFKQNKLTLLSKSLIGVKLNQT